MKFVLLILAVIVLLWLVRGTLRGRVPPPAQKPQEPASAAAPEPMLSCAHCGLHLPRDEALPGRGGVFCGDAHRQAFEQSHPGT